MTHKLKKLYDCRAIPVMYSVQEAVEHQVTNTFGESVGSVEALEGQVRELITIVGDLVERLGAWDVLSGFERATEKEIKAWEER